MIPDWNLAMKAALAGDNRAYEDLLRSFSAFLENFLRRWVNDSELRRDLSQDILLSIHLSRASYDPKLDFKPWAFTIVHRRVIDFIRRRQRENANNFSNDTSLKECGAESVSQSVLDGLTENLSSKERTILEQLYILGHKEQEVANRFDVSLANLRVIAHRIKVKMFTKAKE